MTELELQQIVDGEMASDQRAKCLKQLDPQSPQWRTLALSLLADQDLRRCFQSVQADVAPSFVTASIVPKSTRSFVSHSHLRHRF